MESNHPPQPLSHPPLQWSVPEELVLCLLARISRSYYPKLSLVSKRFKCLLISDELKKVREQLKTQEECIYLCLRAPTYPCLKWFGLWINPNHQISTQRTKNLLVPAPSSCSPASPPKVIWEGVGSDYYKIGQNSPIFYSSSVLVWNELTSKERRAPNMSVERREALTCVLDEKIYVMGGCDSYESTYWAEVFDTKTKTWEPLPDPGPEIRFSSNKEILPMCGDIYLKSKKKNFVYLVKKKKWDVFKDWNSVSQSILIDNVECIYKGGKWWYETKSKERRLRLIKGLTRLYEYHKNDTKIGTSGGKLVIFWDSPAWSHDQTKKIWCAMVLLDKNRKGEVSGQIEWMNVVGTVPGSYILWQCTTKLS